MYVFVSYLGGPYESRKKEYNFCKIINKSLFLQMNINQLTSQNLDQTGAGLEFGKQFSGKQQFGCLGPAI